MPRSGLTSLGIAFTAGTEDVDVGLTLNAVTRRLGYPDDLGTERRHGIRWSTPSPPSVRCPAAPLPRCPAAPLHRRFRCPPTTGAWPCCGVRRRALMDVHHFRRAWAPSNVHERALAASLFDQARAHGAEHDLDVAALESDAEPLLPLPEIGPETTSS